MRHVFRRRSAVVLAALALIVTACGSDNSSNNGGTATTAAPTSAAPGSTTSPVTTTSAGGAATSAAAKPASGDPIKVLQIVLDSPELGITLPEAQAALKGRLQRLNQQGGVLGRPVEVDVCAAGFDPNKANECARKAVDGKYLAVLGSMFANGGDYHAILAAANIPEIYTPYDAKDGAATNGFPLDAGGQGLSIDGAARAVAEFSPKTLVVPHTDSAGGAAAPAAIKAYLDPKGIKTVPLPITRNKPDLSAEVQNAMSSGDAVLVGLTGADLVKFTQGLVQAGYKKFIVLEGAFQPALVQAMGSALDGVKAVSQWAVAGMPAEARDQEIKDLQSVNPKLNETYQSKETWAAGELFAQATAKLTKVDSAELLQILKTTSSFDAGGLMDNIDLTKPGTAVAGQPSMRRFTYVNCTYSGGVCKADAPTWIDPFKA